MRTIPVLTLTLSLLAAPLSGCSKHECKLKTDAEKQALGQLANMTQGAHRCTVSGASYIAGIASPGMKCAIGSKNCVAMMETIHGDGATVESVGTGYKKWLEQNQWTIAKDEPSESQAANGKKLVGREIVAKSDDQGVAIRIYPFGPKLVQARTLLLDENSAEPNKRANR